MRKTRTAILPIPGCDPILNVALLTGQHLRNIGYDLMPFRQKGEITGVPCTGTDESHRGTNVIGTEDARSGALLFVAPMVGAFFGRSRDEYSCIMAVHKNSNHGR